jgi:predicted dehydrogenase
VQGGANVRSQGCHTTYILRYLAGSEPVRLWAAGGTMTHPGHPCIDQCVASIQFAGGAVAAWVQGDAATSPYTSKFFFELFGGGRSVQLYDRLLAAGAGDGPAMIARRDKLQEQARQGVTTARRRRDHLTALGRRAVEEATERLEGSPRPVG